MSMETLYRYVRDKQADRFSPMRRRLLCCVCLEASQGLYVLQAQGGGGFPGKLWDALARQRPCSKMGGEKCQMEEENSRHSSPVDGGPIPLGGDWFSRPLGQDQVFDEDLHFQYPSSTQFCLGQSGDTHFSLVFFFVSWWLSFAILFRRFL